MNENLHNFGHPYIVPQHNQEFIGEHNNSINNLAIEESTMVNHTKNTHGEQVDLIEQNHNSVNTLINLTKNEFARQKAIVKETLQVIRSDYESQKEFLEFFKNHNRALEQLKNGFESKQQLNNYSKNFGNNGGIKINEQNNMNLHNYGNSFIFDQHTRELMAGSSNHLNHLTATELQKKNYLENIKQKNLKDFHDLDKIHQLLLMQNLKNKHIVQKTPNNPQHSFKLNSPSGKTLFEIINENTQTNPTFVPPVSQNSQEKYNSNMSINQQNVFYTENSNTSMNQNLGKILLNEEHGNQRFTGTL
uniref:Uncharacterized protein n=1 Tax=Meloidogyne floridensis TaxID=298350 RepID=A0A915NUR2_9BILA